MIQYQVDLNLRIEDRNSLQHFFVMDLGNKNTVILGHPWLAKTNLFIDWMAGTVRMRGTPVLRHDDPKILEQRYLLRYLHAMEKDNSKTQQLFVKYWERTILTSESSHSLWP